MRAESCWASTASGQSEDEWAMGAPHGAGPESPERGAEPESERDTAAAVERVMGRQSGHAQSAHPRGAQLLPGGPLHPAGAGPGSLCAAAPAAMGAGMQAAGRRP
jgi:hypothetical protein